MRVVALDSPADFDGWRKGARRALMDGVELNDIEFRVRGDENTLFAALCNETPRDLKTSLRVPKDFPQLARRAICHSDPQRFRLLYALLGRLQSERMLLRSRADPLVYRVNVLAKEVARDKHKMTAFVRFRLVQTSQPEHYAAWFEPSHYTLEYTAPFFVRRFTGMRWSIFTPYRSAHWDGKALTFGDGASKAEVPVDDTLEEYWRTYYAHIFNPARVKLKAMQAEMPKKYWKNLPEATLIQSLTHESETRTRAMLANAPTLPAVREADRAPAPVQDYSALADVKRGLNTCQACQLCHGATQVVPGEGPDRAAIMLVGEQPGDHEDLAGRPFVGPAGNVLSAALEGAGLGRDSVYITNAVKHFRYSMRGKRRIRQRPDVSHIDACRWWLMQEISLVRPKVIVALGATAYRSLTGQSAPIAQVRQELATLEMGPRLQTTYHPSAILRAPGDAERASMMAMLTDDIRCAASAAGSSQLDDERVDRVHVL